MTKNQTRHKSSISIPASLRKETDSILSMLFEKVAWLVFTLGTLATAISIFRAQTQGWHPNVILDIIGFSTVIIILLCRKRLPLATVSSSLFIFVGINAIGNFITLGLGTVSFVILTACCIMVVLFFSFKAAMWFLCISVLAVSSVGLLIYSEIIHPLDDLNSYLLSPQTWIMQIFAYIVFVIIMLISVNAIKTRLWQSSLALKKQSDELQESEIKYRLLAENMQDVLFIQDMDLNFTYISPSAEQLFGYTINELMNMKLEKVFAKAFLQKALETFEIYAEKANSKDIEVPLLEFEYLRKNGTTFWGELKSTFLRDKKGNLTGLQGLLREITARKLVEEQINNDLMEKEILIKEIHHRVKNNLNVVISLISLQASTIKTKENALKAFKESINRIYVMALVHEKLYQSDDMTSIAMKSYIPTMVNELLQTYGMTGRVTLNLQLKDVFLDINTAIPCGLILNELVTNALKYAYSDQENGRLKIMFKLNKKEKQYTLEIEDNGPGLPKEFEATKSGTLGLQLVHILIKQLHGNLTINRENGTHIHMTFPLTE